MEKILQNFTKLTVRENHIIELLAHGYTTSEICKKLYIADCTVRIHCTNIYDKLNISNSKKDVCYLKTKLILLYLKYKKILPDDYYIDI